MRIKLVALTASFLLLHSLVFPAAAHHAVLSSSYGCDQSTGMWRITWTIENSETRSGSNRWMKLNTFSVPPSSVSGNTLSVDGLADGMWFPPQPDAGSAVTATTLIPGSFNGAITLSVRNTWYLDPGPTTLPAPVQAGPANQLNTHTLNISQGSCSAPPAASVSSTCDPFGPVQGTINVSVANALPAQTTVTIDGATASLGSNPADAGPHAVVVTVNGQQILSQQVTVGSCSTPQASASSLCDPLGAALGTIGIAVSGLAAEDVAAATINGGPAVFGSNAAAAGTHTVAVTVNGATLLSQEVTVGHCSQPQAAATATCDPFGAAQATLTIAVNGLGPNDVAVATIDGQPAAIGNNAVNAGAFSVGVTINGESILNQEVAVGRCSEPTASVSGRCDPSGPAQGAVTIAVSGLAQGDVALATINGATATVGENLLDAGKYQVIVMVNGETVLSDEVTVAQCVIAGVSVLGEHILRVLPLTGSGGTVNKLLIALALIGVGCALLTPQAAIAALASKAKQ